MLYCPLRSFKGLESITRKVEISQGSRRIQLIEFRTQPARDRFKGLDTLPIREAARSLIAIATDHLR